MVDLAARIPEIGRHDPQKVHDFFVKYQDRIFFATDFQSLERRMILGSSGNEAPPSEADAEVFFRKEYRWLETWDKNWAHMTPIQGNWTISSIGLPAPVLRKIYFDNARQLLARSPRHHPIGNRRRGLALEPPAAERAVARLCWRTRSRQNPFPVHVHDRQVSVRARAQTALVGRRNKRAGATVNLAITSGSDILPE
jgi:hypothetical protein